jgi:hypothetical protein
VLLSVFGQIKIFLQLKVVSFDVAVKSG